MSGQDDTTVMIEPLRSVAGIAIQSDLLFIARRKQDHTEMSHRWEFPGGKVEEGESDESALKREFLEEFGADIDVIRFLGESVFQNKGKTRTLAAWQVSLSSGQIQHLNEHVEVAWLPIEYISKMELADSDRSLIPIVEAAMNSNSGSGHQVG